MCSPQNLKSSRSSDGADYGAATSLDDAPLDEALEGFDKDDLDTFPLTNDEVRLIESAWIEVDREYLENLAAKAGPKRQASSAGRGARCVSCPRSRSAHTLTRRARNARPPAVRASHATTVESVRALLKHSKRINYDARKTLL